jgi:hypothetical protein
MPSKIKAMYYNFKKNNDLCIAFLDISTIRGIILPLRRENNKKHILKHLNELKKAIEKLSSKITFYVIKKMKAMYYNFTKNNDSCIAFFNMKGLDSIFLPERYAMLKNLKENLSFF